MSFLRAFNYLTIAYGIKSQGINIPQKALSNLPYAKSLIGLSHHPFAYAPAILNLLYFLFCRYWLVHAFTPPREDSPSHLHKWIPLYKHCFVHAVTFAEMVFFCFVQPENLLSLNQFIEVSPNSIFLRTHFPHWMAIILLCLSSLVRLWGLRQQEQGFIYFWIFYTPHG